MAKEVGLGDLAEDMITKYQGIVVAVTQHLTGCDRFHLQAEAGKDGKIPDGYSFDITTVKLIRKGAVKPVPRELATIAPVERPGGPPTRIAYR